MNKWFPPRLGCSQRKGGGMGGKLGEGNVVGNWGPDWQRLLKDLESERATRRTATSQRRRRRAAIWDVTPSLWIYRLPWREGQLCFLFVCAHVCLCENETVNTDKIKNQRQLFTKLNLTNLFQHSAALARNRSSCCSGTSVWLFSPWCWLFDSYMRPPALNP